MKGLVQEISKLDVPAGAYDMVWLSREMYSSVPTRTRRVGMVRRIARSLKPGGFFLCQFHWDPNFRLSEKGRFIRRLIGAASLGNLGYEEGDRLWYNLEFVHAFTSEEKIRSELEEGGLSVIYIKTDSNSIRGGAVCWKSPESSKYSVR
jgi:SAM-dependent methyltransferase